MLAGRAVISRNAERRVMLGLSGFRGIFCGSHICEHSLIIRPRCVSALQRVFKVILPNIRFGVMMAALMAFFLSWEEIGVTLFVTSVNAITLPRLMWMGVHDNIDPAVAAVSVVLIVVTTLALTGRMLLQREEAT